ncbi:MAG: class I SAM-dependent methyltransferase [Bacteroidales bacterium]|nr:class I SAM-dependent methyltransferase [Bacteroidales bacterium]
MQDQWDIRYASAEYIYGTEPNQFFANQLSLLAPGKLLLPADGEGRNAVHAARLGWDVHAFDFSGQGRQKALALAKNSKVSIDYQLASFESYPYQHGYYDAVALSFVHLPTAQKPSLFNNITNALKAGGSLVMEAYSKKQLEYKTGGPPVADLMYSTSELSTLLQGLDISLLKEEVVELQEGSYHVGKSAVIRVVAHKPGKA